MSFFNKINIYSIIFINFFLLFVYYRSTTSLDYEKNSLYSINTQLIFYKDVILFGFSLIRIALNLYFIVLYYYNFSYVDLFDYFDSHTNIGLLIAKDKMNQEENPEKEKIINELKHNLNDHLKEKKNFDYIAVLKRIFTDVSFNYPKFLLKFLSSKEVNMIVVTALCDLFFILSSSTE